MKPYNPWAFPLPAVMTPHGGSVHAEEYAAVEAARDAALATAPMKAAKLFRLIWSAVKLNRKGWRNDKK